MGLSVHAALDSPDQPTTPPFFYAQAGGRAAGFERGRVDHDRLLIRRLGGQTLEDRGKHAHLAPALPAIVERLRWALFLWRIAPAQPIAIDEGYPAQHESAIDARFTMAHGKNKVAAAPFTRHSASKVSYPPMFGQVSA